MLGVCVCVCMCVGFPSTGPDMCSGNFLPLTFPENSYSSLKTHHKYPVLLKILTPLRTSPPSVPEAVELGVSVIGFVFPTLGSEFS